MTKCTVHAAIVGTAKQRAPVAGTYLGRRPTTVQGDGAQRRRCLKHGGDVSSRTPAAAFVTRFAAYLSPLGVANEPAWPGLTLTELYMSMAAWRVCRDGAEGSAAAAAMDLNVAICSRQSGKWRSYRVAFDCRAF